MKKSISLAMLCVCCFCADLRSLTLKIVIFLHYIYLFSISDLTRCVNLHSKTIFFFLILKSVTQNTSYNVLVFVFYLSWLLQSSHFQVYKQPPGNKVMSCARVRICQFNVIQCCLSCQRAGKCGLMPSLRTNPLVFSLLQQIPKVMEGRSNPHR